MKKINAWINDIDRLFLLSPSFYSILSGALIAAAINLLTGLFFEKKGVPVRVILSIIFLLFSSGLFIYIGLILEHLHSKAKDIDFLLDMIRFRRRKLMTSAFAGFALVTIGITLLIFAVR